MEIKKIIQILIFTLLLLFSTNIVLADEVNSAVSLKLLNQDPDPVKAGEIVTIRISVENLGNSAIEDYKIRFQDNYPFTLFKSEIREIYVGKIFAHANSGSAQIVKFKLNVDKDISEGSYPVKIIGINSKGHENEKEFLVEIKSQANAEISSISVDSLVPGKKTKVTFGIKNVGKSDLENVKFSWSSENDIILAVGSGNFKYIDRIENNKEELVEFHVVSDLNTEPKLYKLDLILEYDDVESLQKITDAGTIETQQRREIISKAGIYVGGSTDFEISQKDSTSSKVTFSIANIGSNLASSVVLKIPEQKNYQTIFSNSKVIGNIKKGSFGRAEFDVTQIKNNSSLDIIIEYTDTTGLRQIQNKTINVKLQDKTTSSDGSESSDNKALIVIGIIIVGIGIYIYRRRSQEKVNKEHNI